MAKPRGTSICCPHYSQMVQSPSRSLSAVSAPGHDTGGTAAAARRPSDQALRLSTALVRPCLAAELADRDGTPWLFTGGERAL